MLNFLRKKPSPTDSRKNESGSAAQQLAQKVDVSSFGRVINFCLYAMVLLVPIFFTTLTSEPLEFNKQALLFLFTVICLGAWIIKVLTTRKISWVKTSLDYILLVYLGVYLIASMISIDKVSSFLGYYGRFTGSFVSVLMFIVLYFLVVNNVRSERVVKRLVNYLLATVGIVLVYSLLQLLGWFILPMSATHSRSFNPVGSLAGLAIFASLGLIFFQWLLLNPAHRGKLKTWGLMFLTLVALIILLLVNAFVAWLVLALGMVAFLALSMALMSSREGAGGSQQSFMWKPMIILVVAVLFVAFQFLPAVFNPRNLVAINLPVEIQLSNSTTWSLVSNSMGSAPKTAILGSGPGTTGIAFGSIKPQDLNKTIVWSLNFDRASSEIANIAIETGILGLIIFELASILFLVYGLFFLLKKTTHAGWFYALGFFMLWLTLYITHFFYFFNMVFYFLFWLSLAVFMAITHWRNLENAEEESLSFSSSPRSALSWMFLSLLVLAALLIGTFFQAAVVGGEMAYASGVRQLNRAKPDFALAANDFGRALTLNPYRDVYYLAYGQNLIFRASEEAAKPNPNIQQIQSWMSEIINAGQQATIISSGKASNWSALAQFYTNIRSLVSGTDKFILDSWQQAIKRDPKNPSLYVREANAYAIAAQTIDPRIVGTGADTDRDGLSDEQEAKFGSDPENPDTNNNGVSDGDETKAGFNPGSTGRLSAEIIAAYTKTDTAMLKSAENDLRKAIELKADLPDSYVALAKVLEQGGKMDAAKKQLDDAAKLFPTNADILFEQGRLTFNAKDYVAAEKIFNNVVALMPTHANALYSLGLIYLQRGDETRALAQFEKVREITGPNVELEKQINALKAAPAPTK